MDKKWISVGVISVFIVSLTVAAGSATFLTTNSPLFNLRMEQASSRMNFLPRDVHTFTYATGNGYTVNIEVSGFCSVRPMAPDTEPECKPDPISVSGTCDQWTCGDTCWYTCHYVNTCANTCPATCPNTCGVPTCGNTCELTCPETECSPECIPPPGG